MDLSNFERKKAGAGKLELGGVKFLKLESWEMRQKI